MSQHQQPLDEAAQIDDTRTETTIDIGDTADQQDEYTYQCPICGVTYSNEITARVHITRAEDDDHLNHNGLMPEVEVEVLSSDDEVVDTVSRQPEEISLESLSIDQLPAGYPEHHKQIIKIATRNPYASYTELEDLVASESDQLGIEVPSYSTIRRVVREFYHPHDEPEETESLDTLTAKQAAIIIARVLLQDKTHANVADHVGCASSYPPQVYDRAPRVVQRFEDSEGDRVELIKSALSVESMSALTNRGLVDDLPIEFEQVVNEDTETAATGDDEREADQQDIWGSPVNNQTGLRGVPDPDPAVTTPDDEGESGRAQEPSDLDDPNLEISNSSSSDDALRAGVSDLYQQVRFLNDVFCQLDTDHNSDLTEAVTTEVAKRCESILHTGEKE